MPPYPTDAYLSTIWANPGATTDVSRPVFIPRGATYGEAQTVTMTCSTAGATIYYTLDGTTPTTSSPVYTSPITVSASTTVKAFATANALEPSPVEVEDYFIVNQVKVPVISPNGGQFSSAQSATITCPTAGATIRYTLDGSTPTASSPQYSGPVLIASTSTLKAVGFKSGSENSPVASAVFGIGDSYAADEAWTNVSIPTQTGNFTITWNAVPDSSPIDGVMGLSLGSVSGYDGLACIVRFASNGVIDARNGGSYQALAPMNYTAGTMYRFELTVDLASKKYSVKVTPNGGAPVQLATNFGFRTQQATVSTIDHFGMVVLGGGSHIVSDIAIGATSSPTPPSAPQGLRITSAP